MVLAACSSDLKSPVFLEGDSGRDSASDVAVCSPIDPTCGPHADAAPRQDGASGDAPLNDGASALCAHPNTCRVSADAGASPGPRDLGSVSGDVGAEQQTAQGTTSEWFTVRVREDSNGGALMRVAITLLSPALANYDLYVYFDPMAERVVCSPATASSTQQAGLSDSVSLTWGEAGLPNGELDDRTIRIEVRHASGRCDTGDSYTLLVQGNK
jgi:hypothetical protein